MGPPVLVAFANQAAPKLIANHSPEKARTSHAIWSSLFLLARVVCFVLVFLSFSCIFQLIL